MGTSAALKCTASLTVVIAGVGLAAGQEAESHMVNGGFEEGTGDELPGRSRSFYLSFAHAPSGLSGGPQRSQAAMW